MVLEDHATSCPATDTNLGKSPSSPSSFRFSRFTVSGGSPSGGPAVDGPSRWFSDNTSRPKDGHIPHTLHAKREKQVGTESVHDERSFGHGRRERLLASAGAVSTRLGTALRSASIAQIFGADLRSLAVLRIVLASIVLLDLAGRFQNIRVHYTDAGVLPRQVLISELNTWRWSLYLINGTLQFQVALFAITAAAAIAMLLGYRTRLMTLIVWALIFSIQARNPVVLSAADTLLRLLLFWSIFLPLGAWWSIDRQRNGSPVYRSMLFVSIGTVGLFAQIAFMYVFTAILKSGDEWRSDGTALYYALGAKHITRAFGDFLFQFESLLRGLTFASLGLEYLAPILLFFPFFNAQVRTFALFSVMAFQFGIFLTMDLGIFPWTSAFCMVCFLPAWFWDRVVPGVRSTLHRSSGLQRVDTAVSAAISAARTTWRDRRASWARRRRDPSSPVVGVGEEPVTTPRERADPVELRPSWTANLFAAFCLLFVFGWNMASVSDFRMPQNSAPVAYSLGLYQRWAMFAPRPVRSTIWYVYHGRLADGTQLDLLPTIVQDDLNVIQLLSWDEPANISGDLYGDKYWRKYIDEIPKAGKAAERRAYARYICRTWNSHYGGDVALEGFEIVRLHRPTRPNYEEAPVQRTTMAEYTCS
jgi:hypothetical protein